MAWNIHSNYYEDNYVKYECQNCRKGFIVGERLAEGSNLTCPYCQSSEVESTAMADEESSRDMEMGCLGIYFHTYEDDSLMLYTNREFATAYNTATCGNNGSARQSSIGEIMENYCSIRDNKRLNKAREGNGNKKSKN